MVGLKHNDVGSQSMAVFSYTMSAILKTQNASNKNQDQIDEDDGLENIADSNLPHNITILV